MAIGHTRRLCARLPNEANETLHGYKPSHATGLEIANIEAWLHEEGLQIPVDPYNETVQIRIVNHSGDEKEKNHVQQESSGDSADQTEEDEVSSEGTRINETDLPRATVEIPKLELVAATLEKDTKAGKRTDTGAVPKTTKKQAMVKSAANSNQSTPKTTRKAAPMQEDRKATPMQEDLLRKFLDETTVLSQKVDKTIDTWENSNGKANIGKKTAASLERLREILEDSLQDINDTWKDMGGDDDGNKNAKSTHARAVRHATKKTKFAIEQIEAFRQEWQEKANGEKQSTTLDKTRQTKRHTPQTSTRPALERFDRQINTKFGLIPGPNRATPRTNHNNNISRIPTTKTNGHTKRGRNMPSAATIIPRESTGLEPFQCNVRFDMQRAKSLLSETIQHKFGDLFCIAYPGPLAVTDTNGETLHFIGEVSFRIVVEGQSSMMSAWVTNDIEPGLLALGSDIPEDLGLQLYDIPDASTPSGHAEDTATIKDPRGGAPVTRSEKYRVPAPKISYTNNHPSDNFLIPFRYGFHREVVQSAKGTYNIYYHTNSGTRLRTKKEVAPHIEYLQGITQDDFNFRGVILPIDDPTNQYQSIRLAHADRRSTPQATHQESYQTTDDSAHSAEEARGYRPTNRHWAQDSTWSQPEETFTQQDFDPNLYDPEIVRHKDRDREWRQKKPILPSSDETEEDTPRGTRHNTHRENIESERLTNIHRQNKKILSELERDDIKQDPDARIKKEPDDYAQPPQRRQHQREQPPRGSQRRGGAQWNGQHEYTAAPTPRLEGNRQNFSPRQPDNHDRQSPVRYIKREPSREYDRWN